MTSTNRCCHVKADIFERSLMVEVRIGQLLLLHYSNSDSYLGLKNSSSTNTNVCRGGGGAKTKYDNFSCYCYMDNTSK